MIFSRKIHSIKYLLVVSFTLFIVFVPKSIYDDINLPKYGINYINRTELALLTEQTLAANLKEDKFTGCDLHRPVLLSQRDPLRAKIHCPGTNWIKCYLSTCTVNPEIWKKIYRLECDYHEIAFVSDFRYREMLLKNNSFKGNHTYKMKGSDYVKVKCSAFSIETNKRLSWVGFGVGLRPVPEPTPPRGREDTYNVLIICFDSASRMGFTYHMPETFKFLEKEFNAVVLHRYNIVGDGTPAAILPLLTGKTELELPDCRRSQEGSKTHVDSLPFLFYKLNKDGYRTAYFEDMPEIGTFTYRFNGFQLQPTDHYIRPLLMAAQDKKRRDNISSESELQYCLGDAPLFHTMINLTDQFFQLDGKKFSFTFLSDITHEDFRMISNADQPMVDFLRRLKQAHIHDTTLIIVMGDHGVRYKDGGGIDDKYLERLPLMAIRLPDDLIRRRPNARQYLEHNAAVLTTPHDIHATLLDILDMKQYWNPYKVKGAFLKRGMTLLERIPKWRSCSEAGIEPHWCACTSWQMLETSDAMYERPATSLIGAINEMTEGVRSKCAVRVITKIHWVKVMLPNEKVLQYLNMDRDGFKVHYRNETKHNYYHMHYKVKISVSPGEGIFEATVKHDNGTNTMLVNPTEISRTNPYTTEPECISDSYPHLNPYCYCKRILFKK